MKPALTKEEWKTRGFNRPIGYAGQNVGANVGWPWGGINISAEHSAAGLPEVASHALAALALYGQPFGFTREDVELLRKVRRHFVAPGRGEQPMFPLDADTLGDIADRIEALLPPEEL